MFVWIQTLISACVLVSSRPVTDAVGNSLSLIPRSSVDDVLPPVLLGQTRGPVYLQPSGGNSYSTDLWCNTTGNNDVSWLYYDPDSDTTTPLDNGFSGLAFQQQRGIQIRITGGHGNSKLYIVDQRGIYVHHIQCVISNSRGAILGDIVRVDHKAFHVVGNKRLSKHAYVGDHVTLSCDHVVHLPAAEAVEWKFTPAGSYHYPAHLDVNVDNIICVPDLSICTLVNITTSQAGTYRCMFHRGGGTKYVSHELFVNVARRKVDPEHTSRVDFIEEVSSPLVVDVDKGASAKLQCAFIGGAAQEVSWKFVTPVSCKTCAGKIENGRKYWLTKKAVSLLIRQVSEDDEGTYQCSLNNGRYLSTYEITLRLVNPPVLLKESEQFVIAPGQTLHISCPTVHRFLNTRVTWWRNTAKLTQQGQGRFVVGDNGRSVSLYNATSFDSSSLTCNVSNMHGHALGYRHILVTRNRDLLEREVGGYQSVVTDYNMSPVTPQAGSTKSANTTHANHGDQNTSITLKVAHFDILWNELRTLEQRIEMLEGRLNTCLILKTPSLSESIRLTKINAESDSDINFGLSNKIGEDADHGQPGGHGIGVSNELPYSSTSSDKYNIEIRLVRNMTSDMSRNVADHDSLRYYSDDPDIFSTTCYGSNGCRLYSSSPMSRNGDDIVDYSDDDNDEDYFEANAKKNMKRRKHRSSRSKFSDGDKEFTHNLEQRDTYIDNRLSGIRVRYRIIQHSRTPPTNGRTIWSETYNIEISESGSEKSFLDQKMGHLDLVLTFNVGTSNLWDLKTRVKVDIARDNVIGGERCLFRRDFFEWRVNYNNMDALTCHVL